MNFTKNFWTIEKLASRIKEINQKRYQTIVSIKEFDSAPDDEGNNGVYPSSVDFSSKKPIQHIWQGLDQYMWLKTIVDLPVAPSNHRVVGIFDFGITEGGNNAGFEGLAFLNNKVLQGIDTNHTEVVFSKEEEGKKSELAFRLWSGLPGDSGKEKMQHQLKQADICLLDERIDTFYYQSTSILQIIELLDENDLSKIQLTNILNEAYLIIDWDSNLPEKEKESIYKAANFLDLELKKINKESGIVISAFGHAHVDVAWLWRLKHTREKIARTFSSVLRLMEENGDYHFLQSMPQLYDYIKIDYPEIYSQIKEKVAEGKWEVEGGMWVEADCNIPSGESLVRQLLIGQAFFKDEFNYVSKTLWLPDVFGYSWALPQILKLSNIDTFMTTKLGWNEYNSLPTDTFTWRGIDGSEILTHIITTPDDYDQPGFTYNSQMTAEAVVGTWNNYHEKAINQDLLFAFGYGDGGGGPNREMLEMKKHLSGVDGFPVIKSTKVSTYFERLKNTFNESNQYKHVWNGELYFEFHRGTYTSQAINKKLNRQFELRFRKNEMIKSLLTILNNNAGDNETMNEMWKILLRNQFHDIIPGSSIKEVYEDSLLEYKDLEEKMNIEETKSFNLLIKDSDKHIHYFDSTQWGNSKIIKIHNLNNQDVYLKNEKIVTQRIGFNTHLALVESKALAFNNLEIKKSNDTNEENHLSVVQPEDYRLETPFYVVKFNSKGQISYLLDKEVSRLVNPEGKPLNVFQVFTDKPIQFDAWNIDSFYQEKHDEIVEMIAMSEETGEIRTTISIEWMYRSSSICQKIHFYKHSKRIDFETHVDWHEASKLLKIAFPVDIHTTEATYDIQYGNVKRPNHWNTSWDFAKFETVAHQWVDMSERDYGVSLLNDCKYGHDIKDNVIRLTLIKSAEYPDKTQDIGGHEFTYALLPHKGDFIEGEVVNEASDLNNPIEAYPGIAQTTDAVVKINSNHVMVNAVKLAEDTNGFIVRVHEFGGKREEITFTSDFDIESVDENNLMEEYISNTTLKLVNNEVKVFIKPYEIKTFRINFRK